MRKLGINPLTVNKNDNVKVTTRVSSGKMYAKLLLMRFIYELTETFYFRNKKTIEIYSKYNIQIIFPYHVLANTDSTCLMFLIIFNVKNSISNKKFGEVLFEVIVANKICNRFDTSHPS